MTVAPSGGTTDTLDPVPVVPSLLAVLRRLDRPVYAVLAVAALAGGLRFGALSYPPERIFDEFYYSKAACILIGGSNETCAIRSDDERYWRREKWDVGSWVHPPLGKWMIGLGEKAFGVTPFGWRSSAALAGTLTCVFVAMTAQVLWSRPVWTFVAGLLLATEHLNFVLSRVALLDIFVAFWVVLGILFLALDHRWIDRRTPEPRAPDSEGPLARVPSPIWRPWRLAAGAALGAAAATKWSGALALPAAVLVSYGWETTRRRREGIGPGRALARAFLIETFPLLLSFVVVPAVVYVATYAPWFNHFGWSPAEWWVNQKAMFRFHANLEWSRFDAETETYTPIHPYLSRAWSWLAVWRPVLFFARYDEGTVRWITSLGNIAIMWASVFTIPFTAWLWRRRRDWTAGLVVVPFLVQYLPWFRVDRPTFFFYMAPITPLLVLAAAYTAKELADARIVQRDTGGGLVVSERAPYRPLVVGYVALAVLLFVWAWPVLVGMEIPRTWWRAIVWFRGWS
jgi:dolichyl-phosphate-mannose--protein O-mannosyl transferase